MLNHWRSLIPSKFKLPSLLVVLLLAVQIIEDQSLAKTPAQKAGDIIRSVGANEGITLVLFDSTIQAFQIQADSDPETGPFFATPDSLVKACGFDGITTAKDLMKKKDDLMESHIILRKDLVLLTENQVAQRKKSKSGKN